MIYKVKSPCLQATSSLSHALRLYADAFNTGNLIRRPGTRYDYAANHLLLAGSSPPLTPEAVAANLPLTTEKKWWVVVVGKETGVFCSKTLMEYLSASGNNECAGAVHYSRPTRAEALAAYEAAYYSGYVFKI